MGSLPCSQPLVATVIASAVVRLAWVGRHGRAAIWPQIPLRLYLRHPPPAASSARRCHRQTHPTARRRDHGCDGELSLPMPPADCQTYHGNAGWRSGRVLARWRRRSVGPAAMVPGFPHWGLSPSPWVVPLRFQRPPIEPCVRFSRTRLTDVLHRRHSASPARAGWAVAQRRSR
jgi:hypothetical protein